MPLSTNALASLVELILTTGKDSDGLTVRNRYEAELIASLLLLRLANDPLFPQVLTEVIDELRHEKIGR